MILKNNTLPLIVGVFILIFTNTTKAQLYDGKLITPVTNQDILNRLKPGTILIIGEMHGLSAVQTQQLELLNAIRSQGFKLNIGFEFLNYTDQKNVNDYRLGSMTDDQFKTSINWGKGIDFNFYKTQILFPLISKTETSIGLNIPNSVTKQIALAGVNSLTSDQRSLLPNDFTLGACPRTHNLV